VSDTWWLASMTATLVACVGSEAEPAREPPAPATAPTPLCGVPGVDAPWPTSPGEDDLRIVRRPGTLGGTPAEAWWLIRCGVVVQGEACQVTFLREKGMFQEPGERIVADPAADAKALEAGLRERFAREGFVETAATSVALMAVAVGSANGTALGYRRGERERTLSVTCVGARCSVIATDGQVGCAAPGGAQWARLAPDVEPTRP
jgi:hypothetical protein